MVFVDSVGIHVDWYQPGAQVVVQADDRKVVVVTREVKPAIAAFGQGLEQQVMGSSGEAQWKLTRKRK